MITETHCECGCEMCVNLCEVDVCKCVNVWALKFILILYYVVSQQQTAGFSSQWHPTLSSRHNNSRANAQYLIYLQIDFPSGLIMWKKISGRKVPENLSGDTSYILKSLKKMFIRRYSRPLCNLLWNEPTGQHHLRFFHTFIFSIDKKDNAKIVLWRFTIKYGR